VVRLARGDRLFLYTDGLVSGQSADGKAFGNEGLLDAANKFRDERPQPFTEAIFRAAGDFTQGKTTPLTLLAFEYGGGLAA